MIDQQTEYKHGSWDRDDGEQLRPQSLPNDEECDLDHFTTSTEEGAAFLLARELSLRTELEYDVIC